jgi:hypothetical protein
MLGSRPPIILRAVHQPPPAPDPFRPRFRLRAMAWVGIAVLALGVGPLVGILLAARMGWTSDPNPNPIGPGMLAMCSAPAGLVLAALGTALSIMDMVRDRPTRR